MSIAVLFYEPDHGDIKIFESGTGYVVVDYYTAYMFEPDEVIYLMATVDTGYEFYAWTNTSGKFSDNFSTQPSFTCPSSGSVTINFTTNVPTIEHTVTYDSTESSLGEFYLSGVPSGSQMSEGSYANAVSVGYTVEGVVYIHDKWSVEPTSSGSFFDDPTSDHTKFYMGTADTTIHATYKKDTTTPHTITPRYYTNGTISPLTGYSLAQGQTGEFTAIPDYRYKFLKWAITEGCGSLSSTTDNPTTFTMSYSNGYIDATFATATLFNALSFDTSTKEKATAKFYSSSTYGTEITEAAIMNWVYFKIDCTSKYTISDITTSPSSLKLQISWDKQTTTSYWGHFLMPDSDVIISGVFSVTDCTFSGYINKTSSTTQLGTLKFYDNSSCSEPAIESAKPNTTAYFKAVISNSGYKLSNNYGYDPDLPDCKEVSHADDWSWQICTFTVPDNATLIVTGYCEGRKYTVKFDRYSDGTKIDTLSNVEFGVTFPTIAVPEPKSEGYTFLGYWSIDSSGTKETQYVDSTGVGIAVWDHAEDNYTLYGYWRTVTVKIYIYDNNETGNRQTAYISYGNKSINSGYTKPKYAGRIQTGITITYKEVDYTVFNSYGDCIKNVSPFTNADGEWIYGSDTIGNCTWKDRVETIYPKKTESGAATQTCTIAYLNLALTGYDASLMAVEHYTLNHMEITLDGDTYNVFKADGSCQENVSPFTDENGRWIYEDDNYQELDAIGIYDIFKCPLYIYLMDGTTTWKQYYINYNATIINDFSLDPPVYEGHTLSNIYTTNASGTNYTIFDGNGNCIKNVSPYTDTDGKWIYTSGIKCYCVWDTPVTEYDLISTMTPSEAAKSATFYSDSEYSKIIYKSGAGATVYFLGVCYNTYLIDTVTIEPSTTSLTIVEGTGPGHVMVKCYFTMPAQAATIKVTFKLPTTSHILSIDDSIENGYIQEKGSTYTLNENETKELHAIANTGYTIDTWSISKGSEGGSTIYPTTTATTTFTMGTADATVTCSFKSSTGAYTITVICIGCGYCEASPSKADKGTVVTLTPSPHDGWEFTKFNLIYTDVSIGSDNSFIMPAHDVTIFAVFDATVVYYPMTSSVVLRYKIILDNGTNQYILTRKPTNNMWFRDLNYSQHINKSMSGNVVIYFPNNYTSDIVDVGTHLIVTYNDYPVYYGYITSYEQEDNMSYYYGSARGNVFNVTFEDIIREYNYRSISSLEIYSGNPGFIARNIILPRNNGRVNMESRLLISYNPSGNSRMLALTNLGNQSGWRYRSCPRIIMAYNGNVQFNGSSIGVTQRLSAFDSKVLVIVKVSTGTPYIVRLSGTYSGLSGGYYWYPMEQYITSITITDTMVIALDQFQIDFDKSFYQTDSVVIPDEKLPTTEKKAWSSNNTAQNVFNANSSNSKYGSVCVSSASGYGGMISCTIPLMTTHTKDYTMGDTTTITYSSDFDVYQYEITSEYVILYVNGNASSFKPEGGATKGAIMWISTIDNQYDKLTVPAVDFSNGEVKYFSSNNYMKPDTTYIKFTNTGTEGNIVYEINKKLPCVIHCIYGGYTSSAEDCTYYIANDILSTGDEVYIGGEHTTVKEISGYSIKVNRNYLQGEPSKIIYAHMIGTLVTKVGSGNTANEDSPYSLYPDRTLSVTTKAGLSYMQVERLSCVIAQYGSNFDCNGTCNIPLQNFTKIDTVKTLPQVGDHIALYEHDKEIKHYELLSYEIQCDYATVTITYGTANKTMDDFVYSIYKNSNVNIIRG